MDKIEFKTSSGTLMLDKSGRFQMMNSPNYVSIKLKPYEIDDLIKFWQNRITEERTEV